jgi:UDP-N-acetylmuramoyl-tripeptide--D-alanyl-D-alanine ligase
LIELAPDQIAGSIDAGPVRQGHGGRPSRAEVDSRRIAGGELFFWLPGARTDGGAHARAALEAGAWGAVVEADRASELAAGAPDKWVFGVADPLAALQSLATAWRRELGCRVVGITGSVGKTSVKDIVRAILPLRAHASPENFNTEIGLPLTILAAPPETDVLVLEMAMRGLGQIAELCEIAEPDVGAITNIGPVHLELLGTIEAIAEAKAEILEGLGHGGIAVVPADAEALEPHLTDRIETITFGAGGDVHALDWRPADAGLEATIVAPEGEVTASLPFTEAHNLANAVCAFAIGVALGCDLDEMSRRSPRISFSRLRGELIELPGGSVLVNDCYNANPVSMHAALDHLAALEASGRRIAVLGGMAELGPGGAGYHREAAAYARSLGIDRLVGVGELARDYAPDAWAPDPESAVEPVRELLSEGDAILVKGSRSVGMEAFTDTLLARIGDGE